MKLQYFDILFQFKIQKKTWILHISKEYKSQSYSSFLHLVSMKIGSLNKKIYSRKKCIKTEDGCDLSSIIIKKSCRLCSDQE